MMLDYNITTEMLETYENLWASYLLPIFFFSNDAGELCGISLIIKREMRYKQGEANSALPNTPLGSLPISVELASNLWSWHKWLKISSTLTPVGDLEAAFQCKLEMHIKIVALLT